MIQHPTRPGQRCQIIDSINGQDGKSVGKECVTVFLHDDTLRMERYDADRNLVVVDLGPLWHVRGKALQSEMAVSDEIDCPAIWLKVIDEPDAAELRQVDRALVLHP